MNDTNDNIQEIDLSKLYGSAKFNDPIEPILSAAINKIEVAKRVADLPDSAFSTSAYLTFRNCIRSALCLPDFTINREGAKEWGKANKLTPFQLGAFDSLFRRLELYKSHPSITSLAIDSALKNIETKAKRAALVAKAKTDPNSITHKDIEDCRGSVSNSALDTLSRSADRNQKQSAPVVTLTSFGSLEAKPIQWLVNKRIPLGKITIFAGDGGTNKSTVAYDLAARVSSGSLEPMGETRMDAGDCILVAGDDEPETDILPRLQLMGANVNRIFAIDIRVQVNGRLQSKMFDLSDITSVRDALEKQPTTKLLVIDPVSAFVGKKDANKHADIYSLMTPLNQLAAEFGIAIIIVAHTNKKTGSDFRSKINGSTAWTDAARASYLFTKDANDADRRLMSAGKINAARQGKALAFRVVEKPHPEAGSAITIEWEGEVDMIADEVLQMTSGTEAKKRNEAKAFISERLASGDVESTVILEEAKAVGISGETLFDAKKELGIECRREGFGRGGRYYWSNNKKDSGNANDEANTVNDNAPW